MAHDLIGNKFGTWTVLEQLSERRGTSLVFKCQCECGTICNQTSNILTSGKSSKCQKCYKDALQRDALSLIGNKYSSWTVVALLEEKGPKGASLYSVRCDCGNMSKRVRNQLKDKKSCRECFYRRKIKICGECLCKGHKDIDWDNNECELMGYCKYCDK
jgi:hypothetical protein